MFLDMRGKKLPSVKISGKCFAFFSHVETLAVYATLKYISLVYSIGKPINSPKNLTSGN